MQKEDRYDSLFVHYTEGKDVDWKLLKAQVRQESAFNPKAVSSVGAMGLAQFMPATWREWGEGIPTNPEESIKAQAKYMAWLLQKFNWEMEWALAAYNWGIGNVQKLKARRRGSFVELMSEMPEETVDYVDRILTYHKQYQGNE